MNRNSRIALALVGILILIVAAFVIAGRDGDTTATEQEGTTPATTAPTTGSTGSTGASGGGSTGGAGGGSDTNDGATSGTGGASPQEGTGGASPGDSTEDESTGGAKVSTKAPLLVAGKVAKINIDKGGIVRLRARSAQTDHMHIHGYDYMVDLPAGKIVNYKFKADIDGVFEIEFEEQGLEVAKLRVSP